MRILSKYATLSIFIDFLQKNLKKRVHYDILSMYKEKEDSYVSAQKTRDAACRAADIVGFDAYYRGFAI
jgi:hypothetical protein